MLGILHRSDRDSLLPSAFSCAFVAILAVSSTNANGQQLSNPPGILAEPSLPSQGPPTEGFKQKSGDIAASSVGTAGRRQEQGIANIRPMARLETRFANRVQSRIRNRIDRFYDPRANTVSPFKVASDQDRARAVTGRIR